VQSFRRHLSLLPADVGICKNRLALQVRFIDNVVVNDADPPDSGRGEILQRRGAEAARSDDERACGVQPLLTGQTDFRNEQMAAIPARDAH
jgi:hypothetical protein